MDTPAFPQVELATFETQPPRGGGQAETITVQFNPESLQYTASNTLKAQGRGRNKKQYVDKTEAKLSMTLVFDTTHNGQDVRVQTDKMAKLLRPVAQGNKQVPPNVEFGWGSYSFRGMVEQYKETLDFFAANGVPLRASVEVTLTSQDVQFDSASGDIAGVDGQNASDTPVVPATGAGGGGGGGGPAGLANQLGDPRAARAIAAANGAASLRFGGEAGLAIDAGIELQGEAAFSLGAGGGLGLGIGAGAGAGLSAGAGLDAGLGGGFGAAADFGSNAGFSVGAGANASFGADLGAAAGNAFAELRTVTPSPPSLPDAAGVFSASAGVDIGAGAQIGIGGAAQAGGGGGLTADVGAEADLNAMIRFS